MAESRNAEADLCQHRGWRRQRYRNNQCGRWDGASRRRSDEYRGDALRPARRATRRPMRWPTPARAARRPAPRSAPARRRWCRWPHSVITSSVTRRSRSITRGHSSRQRSRSTSRPAIRSATLSAAIDQAVHDIGMPASIHGSFQGTARTFQASLASEPLLILAALVAVYIVLGVLYESSDPSDHHPVHAALGGRRRGAGAVAVPHRIQHHRADRRDPADRHREEERDPDDRFRAGGGARRRACRRARRFSKPASSDSARS